MSLVVLQPAGSEASQKHYADTVVNSVPLSECAALPQSDLAVLHAAFPDGNARFWGATRAVNGSHIKKHAKLRPGDYVLFVKDARVFSGARIRHAFRSEELAEKLWKRDKRTELTWELMFAIDEVRELDVSVEEINESVGYDKGNSVQGFMVLDASKSAAVCDLLDLDEVEGALVQPDPDEHNLPEFKPKSSSDYVTAITSHVQTKTRKHERLVSDYGRAIAKTGITPATNVHPCDLTLTEGDRHWLVEVKVVYNGNATDAVRAVVGQLFQYRHFLYPETKPSLVGLFTEPIGDGYVDFLEQLGIHSIWREGGKWSGSDAAFREGLVPNPS